MENEIQVLIADDHPIFRQGLRQLIESAPGIKVVTEAGNGAAALESLQIHKPAVAVLDIDMPDLDGFGVVAALHQFQLPIRVIFLTMHKEEEAFNQALDAGVQGYVLKDSAASEIVNSIRAVAQGQPFISPSMSAYLLNQAAAQPRWGNNGRG